MLDVTEQDIKDYYQMKREQLARWKEDRMFNGFNKDKVVEMYNDYMNELREDEGNTMIVYEFLDYLSWRNNNK